MFAFVLVVRLYADGPVLMWPVESCEEGAMWIREASHWAERSHVPIEDGPIYVCYPADSPALMLVRH